MERDNEVGLIYIVVFFIFIRFIILWHGLVQASETQGDIYLFFCLLSRDRLTQNATYLKKFMTVLKKYLFIKFLDIFSLFLTNKSVIFLNTYLVPTWKFMSRVTFMSMVTWRSILSFKF